MSSTADYLLQLTINENDALKVLLEEKEKEIEQLKLEARDYRLKLKIGVPKLRSSIKSALAVLEGDGKLVDRMIIITKILAMSLEQSERYVV